MLYTPDELSCSRHRHRYPAHADRQLATHLSDVVTDHYREYSDCLSGCGRTTTVATCTCCSSTCAEVSYSRTCAMPASSPTAPVCSMPPRSRPLSTTCTRCLSSTVIWSQRISCWTKTVILSWPTSDLPRSLKTGSSFCYVNSALGFV